MASLEDESARGSMGFADADWINFETTVSTSPDQIALAPGYLQREWTEHGRRYFHYRMDRLIEATRKSLDYFTANFSPYQHKQVRIPEFPRYPRFAQSFANTIAFSESIGFIAS